jgi:hypothetical protein
MVRPSSPAIEAQAAVVVATASRRDATLRATESKLENAGRSNVNDEEEEEEVVEEEAAPPEDEASWSTTSSWDMLRTRTQRFEAAIFTLLSPCDARRSGC